MANKGDQNYVKSLGDLSPKRVLEEVAKKAVPPSQVERQAKGSK